MTALVQELGLSPDTPTVVVYTGIDATDFGGAARVYWTLKSLGVRQLAILNGGLTAWKAAGQPVSDQAAVAPRSRWQPQFNPQWLATREQVRASLEQPGVLRVDARPAPYHQGRIATDLAHARGTLPGAVNLDSENFFELGSAALMDSMALEDEADKLKAAPGEPIITFCNTGHWSATDWFVLSELLGRPGVRMYAGSIIDWTSAPAPLPMDNEPGRWQQLLRRAELGAPQPRYESTMNTLASPRSPHRASRRPRPAASSAWQRRLPLSVAIAALFGWLLWSVSARQALLLLVGVGLGATLAAARFGFTTGWRVLVEKRDPSGVYGQIVLLALLAALSMPIVAHYAETTAALGPLSVSLLVGAFVFGLCMQVADGCGSASSTRPGWACR
jgi:thiosulfate/3-mercaptopyruvate sulfurtransferase